MGDEPLDLRAVGPGTFEPHVASAFELQRAAGPALSITLASVTPYPAQPGVIRAQPFSLLFTGPDALQLPQGVYRLTHPALGSMDVFLVPVGPQPGLGLGYEAVFN